MTLLERKELMKKYLLLKLEEEDFHGVCDAGMDLRDIQIEINIRKELETYTDEFMGDE